MSKNILLTGFVVAGLAIGLAACSKNELASKDEDPGVFVEVEQAINPEIGNATSLTDNIRGTRRVRLSQKDLDELERLGNSPRVAQVRRASLSYCPSVQVLAGTGVLTAYSSSTEDIETSQEIDHQATITRSGRECKVEDGKLIVRVGAAGRAIKGPKSSNPNVALPIRVAIIEDTNQVLFSQLYAHPILFQSGNAQGFSFVQENVEVPFPQHENLKIFVGFDTKDGPLAARLGQENGATDAVVAAAPTDG